MKLSSSLSSKPTSSPVRSGSEKFQLPLLSLLRRSNVGSRSRPRSKPTPLFFRKKKPVAQEPSSPKVTCIGQVRVSRSKISSSTKPSSTKKRTQLHCKWKVFRPVWCISVRVFCCGLVKVPPNGSNTKQNNKKQKEIETGEIKTLASASESTPPKNALLLTRCRSAPYRSSSLACQFWGSALTEKEEVTKPNLEIEKNSVMGSSEVNNAAVDERFKEIENGSILIKLVRCKSEPVKRGSQKLDPLTSEFWKERRLSNTQ